jgi:Ala-tRNA(Pro) deacylase
MTSLTDRIVECLEQRGVPFSLSEHRPVKTSAEAARVRGVELRTGAKAMVVSASGGIVLAVLPADRRIDWRKLKRALDVDDASLASPEEAERLTGVPVGSVPPLANLLHLNSVFDPALLENELIRFNAGSRTHSIEMRSEDLVQVVGPTVVASIS